MPAIRTHTQLGSQQSIRRTLKRYSRPSYIFLTIMAVVCLAMSADAQGGFTSLQVKEKAFEMAKAASHKLGSRASRAIEDKAIRLFVNKGYIKNVGCVPREDAHGRANLSKMQVDDTLKDIIVEINAAMEMEDAPSNDREAFVQLSTHLRNAIDPKDLKASEQIHHDSRMFNNLLCDVYQANEKIRDLEAQLAGPSTSSLSFTTPLRPAHSRGPLDPAAVYATPESLPRPRAGAEFQLPSSPSRRSSISRATSFDQLGLGGHDDEPGAGYTRQALGAPPPEDPQVTEWEGKFSDLEQRHEVVLAENSELRGEAQDQASQIVGLNAEVTVLSRENVRLTAENTHLTEEAIPLRRDQETLIRFREYTLAGLSTYQPSVP